MRRTKRVATCLAATLMCVIGAKARAAIVNINLTGRVSDLQAIIPGKVPLEGLSSLNPITVAQGDQVNVTVSLDGIYTVPSLGTVRDEVNDDFHGPDLDGLHQYP